MNRTPLVVDRLENRRMMAADIWLAEGQLNIVGTHLDDQIVVSQYGQYVIAAVGNGYVTNSKVYYGSSVARVSIDAAGGNDQVYNVSAEPAWIWGGDGNDYLWGGPGGNSIWGQNGDDVVLGGISGDYLDGGNGNDLVSGNAGSDYVIGGYGNDALYGGDGNDSLYGQNGNDLIWGDLGADVLDGGYDHDLLVTDVALQSATESVRDFIYGTIGSDFVNGSYGRDTIVGYGRYNPVDHLVAPTQRFTSTYVGQKAIWGAAAQGGVGITLNDAYSKMGSIYRDVFSNPVYLNAMHGDGGIGGVTAQNLWSESAAGMFVAPDLG